MKEEVSEQTKGEQSSDANPETNGKEAVTATENGVGDSSPGENGEENRACSDIAEEDAGVTSPANKEVNDDEDTSVVNGEKEAQTETEPTNGAESGEPGTEQVNGGTPEEPVKGDNTEKSGEAAVGTADTMESADNATTDNEKVLSNTSEQTKSGEAIDVAPEEVEFPRERRLTAYERLSNDLSGDQKVQKEITLGKRIGFYRIRGELGSGNFSQVKMGIHALTKEKVAVKILDKTKLDHKTQRLLSREISSMDKMHHPNIIRLYEVVETLAKLHIVMEYAGGGELFHKISNEGKMPETDAKIIYTQVLAAVEHMHEKNIIHRDLKAENVFYAGPRFVKVGDFGFSTCSPADQTLNTFCGSPPYAAPELFKDEHYFGIFVDIWAMGIMLYFMVCGVMPFRADTVSKLKKCILEGSFVIPNFVSDSCQFLIRGVLRPIPHDRFSLAEIQRSDFLEGQEHPIALPPYNMNPSGDGAELTEEELETRSILHDLGINEAHIKECHGKDSRSCINGTYRIVLHKVQRKRSGRIIDSGPDFEAENAITEEKYSKAPKGGKKFSKFCVIL